MIYCLCKHLLHIGEFRTLRKSSIPLLSIFTFLMILWGGGKTTNRTGRVGAPLRIRAQTIVTNEVDGTVTTNQNRNFGLDYFIISNRQWFIGMSWTNEVNLIEVMAATSLSVNCWNYLTNWTVEASVTNLEVVISNHWSGAQGFLALAPTQDSDGDTLSDFMEIGYYRTLPKEPDTDGDGYPDDFELAAGTSPAVSNSWLTLSMTSITNAEQLQTVLRTAEAHQIFELTGGEYDLGSWNRLSTNRFMVTSPDGQFGEVILHSDQSGPMFVTSTNESRGSIWRGLVLDPTNSADAFIDGIDNDKVYNIHEFWLDTDPNVYDATNTALYAITHGVEDLITDTDYSECGHKFNNYVTNGVNGIFITNGLFWARSIDTSCASVWNKHDYIHGEFRGGVLISRRHMLFASHFTVNEGTTVWFYGRDGNLYSNTVARTRRVSTTDIRIASLAQDMNDQVSSAYFLPTNYYAYIGSGLRLPALSFNQCEQGVVWDVVDTLGRIISSDEYDEKSVKVSTPAEQSRLKYNLPIKRNDSGNPIFFVIGKKVIILCTIHYGLGYESVSGFNSGSGPFVTEYINEIQAVMNYLQSGYSLQVYDLTRFDLIPNK